MCEVAVDEIAQGIVGCEKEIVLLLFRSQSELSQSLHLHRLLRVYGREQREEELMQEHVGLSLRYVALCSHSLCHLRSCDLRLTVAHLIQRLIAEQQFWGIERAFSRFLILGYIFIVFLHVEACEVGNHELLFAIYLLFERINESIGERLCILGGISYRLSQFRYKILVVHR